jgi:hypothetical protein
VLSLVRTAATICTRRVVSRVIEWHATGLRLVVRERTGGPTEFRVIAAVRSESGVVWIALIVFSPVTAWGMWLLFCYAVSGLLKYDQRPPVAHRPRVVSSRLYPRPFVVPRGGPPSVRTEPAKEATVQVTR